MLKNDLEKLMFADITIALNESEPYVLKFKKMMFYAKFLLLLKKILADLIATWKVTTIGSQSFKKIWSLFFFETKIAFAKRSFWLDTKYWKLLFLKKRTDLTLTR